MYHMRHPVPPLLCMNQHNRCPPHFATSQPDGSFSKSHKCKFAACQSACPRFHACCESCMRWGNDEGGARDARRAAAAAGAKPCLTGLRHPMAHMQQLPACCSGGLQPAARPLLFRAPPLVRPAARRQPPRCLATAEPQPEPPAAALDQPVLNSAERRQWTFADRCQQLAAFREQHGHTRVPAREPSGGLPDREAGYSACY